jgi:hypothetical protein
MIVMALYNPFPQPEKHVETSQQTIRRQEAAKSRSAGLCWPSRGRMSSIQQGDHENPA